MGLGGHNSGSNRICGGKTYIVYPVSPNQEFSRMPVCDLRNFREVAPIEPRAASHADYQRKWKCQSAKLFAGLPSVEAFLQAFSHWFPTQDRASRELPCF